MDNICNKLGINSSHQRAYLFTFRFRAFLWKIGIQQERKSQLDIIQLEFSILALNIPNWRQSNLLVQVFGIIVPMKQWNKIAFQQTNHKDKVYSITEL